MRFGAENATKTKYHEHLSTLTYRNVTQAIDNAKLQPVATG
jgi:hypothetical protein